MKHSQRSTETRWPLGRWPLVGLVSALALSFGCGRTLPLGSDEREDAGGGVLDGATPPRDGAIRRDGAAPGDGSARRDGSVQRDGAVRRDGGPLRDRGVPDRDRGPQRDAALRRDAGVVRDAATRRDAGPRRDSSVVRDATLPRDASPRRDAAVRPDRGLPPQRPDLLISSFTYQAAATGESVYTIVTCNRGGAASVASLLGLFFDFPSAPAMGTPPSRWIGVGALAADRCQSTRLTLTLPSGNYRSWAIADAPGAVSESDEGNNRAGPLVFAVAPGRADLVISSFAVAAGTAERATSYQATVCNRGRAASPAVRLAFYFDRLQAPQVGARADRELLVSGLQPQQCRSQTLSVLLPSGAYFSWALIDAGASVTESDESNNTSGPQVFMVLAGSTIPPQCLGACAALVAPCGLLRSNQQQSCALLCASRSPAQIACAGAAAASGRCFSIVSCLLLP